MRFLRNTWYVAMWSQDLKPGELQQRLILDEAIVLFRNASGQVAALLDRCPHRFVPLSLGKVCEGNSVQCPYHGLAFDATGVCVRNPNAEGRIPPALRVRRFPVVERHGAIWVWMGDREADPAAAARHEDGLSGECAHGSRFESLDWLEAALKTLDENRKYLKELLDEKLPQVGYRIPDFSYLAWLDLSALNLGENPGKTLLEKEKVAFNHGITFGPTSGQFVRFNFGTSKEIIDEAVERIVRASK